MMVVMYAFEASYSPHQIEYKFSQDQVKMQYHITRVVCVTL
jgi:hypothetical protein